MWRKCSGMLLQTRSAAVKSVLCRVFVLAIALSQASATTISNIFIGFSPDPFTQGDKTYGGWTGNLPGGFSTLISLRTGIVPGEDLHTASFSATFLPNTTYTVSYYIMASAPALGITEASSGVRTTIPGATIMTTFSEVPAFSISTGTASGLVMLSNGPYTLLHVTDVITTGFSDITGFSNSFIQQVPTASVPESGGLAMLGTGTLAAAACLRRKLL